jgi:hypothetical protein
MTTITNKPISYGSYYKTIQYIDDSDTNVTVNNNLYVNNDGFITGNLTVDGDLLISGTTVTVNTEQMVVKDPIITISSLTTGTPTENAGLLIERGDLTDASLIWSESDDKFKCGLAGSEKDIAVQSSAIQDLGICVYSTDNQQIESYNKLTLSYDGKLTVGINNNPDGLINGCYPYSNSNATADLLSSTTTPKLSFVGQDTTNYNNVLYTGADRGAHLILKKDTDITSGQDIRNIAGVSLLTGTDGISSNIRMYTNTSGNVLTEGMSIDKDQNVNIGGKVVQLNSSYAKDNTKIVVKRNASARASLKWSEDNGMWACGLENSELPIMPFYSFEPQTESLMFLKADGLVTTDVDLTYDSTNKRLGLGIAVPTAKMHITNPSSSSSASFIVEDSDSPDADPFCIDASGNVGIGILAPSSNTKLHIRGTTILNPTVEGFAVAPKWEFKRAQGTSTSPTNVISSNAIMNFNAYGSNNGAYVQGASISAVVDSSLGNTTDMPCRLVFSTCPQSGVLSERMRIDRDGNICIGTTNNDGKITIVGSTLDSSVLDSTGHALNGIYKAISFQNSGRKFYVGEGFRTGLNQDFSLLSSDTGGAATPINHLSFDCLSNNLYLAGHHLVTGNMGVGTVSPSAKVHIVQTAAAASLRVDDQASDTTPFIIDENGKVGINNPTPSYTLDVAGDCNITTNLIADTIAGKSYYVGRVEKLDQDYTILSTDFSYVTPGSTSLTASRTFTLPLLSGVLAKRIMIKDEGSINGTNKLTIQRQGANTIQGSLTSVTIDQQFGSFEFIATANGWMIVNYDSYASSSSILVKNNVSYTILYNDPTYILTGPTAYTSARTFTLPLASACSGKKFVIKDASGAVNGANTLSIVRAGSDTIEGGTSLSINSAWGCQELLSTGSAWVRLNFL